jgi:hypothetical protein
MLTRSQALHVNNVFDGMEAMVLRNGTTVEKENVRKVARKPENVFTVIRTRSQSKLSDNIRKKLSINTTDSYLPYSRQTPPVPSGSSRAPQYSVNINFDDASREWRRNKRSMGNGTYAYK